MSEPELSLVVPCFNETGRLGPTISRILAWTGAQGFETEIVIVDDGSSDGTADLARQQLADVPHQVIVHPENRGKGAGLRTGMLAAHGRHVLFTDADLSTPIDQAGRFLEAHAAGAAVVIGTRKSAGAEVTEHQPWLRENMGKVFTFLANKLVCDGVSDFTCGFKSFTQTASRDVFSRLREEGWAFDAEVLHLVRRGGHSISEVPVPWANDPNTRVRLARDALGSFAGLLRIRSRSRSGVYDAPFDESERKRP